ncbi:MAG: fluoride efflux transporter CrcB [Thermoanaerobaculia bacterium]|nr:fluoride efflux transporter CrcB [Thermoanaerobaculia bacterium]
MVCIGGAAGSGARYLISVWMAARFGSAFPLGTLAVNLGGSFLLALLMQISLASDVLSPEVRLALTTGALGGFTTYSTFNYETTVLVQEGAFLLASLNVALTILGCLLAGWLGFWAGKIIVG